MQEPQLSETPTLSTDADRRTDTNLKRLRDLSKKKRKKRRKKEEKNLIGCVIKKKIYIYIYKNI